MWTIREVLALKCECVLKTENDVRRVACYCEKLNRELKKINTTAFIVRSLGVEREGISREKQ